jgi:hypothetical protein
MDRAVYRFSRSTISAFARQRLGIQGRLGSFALARVGSGA